MSALLITGESGDTFYVGDLDAGKALVQQDRWAVETTLESGLTSVVLHDTPTLDSAAEWGTGKTSEEAWRYAIGAAVGPMDAEYDEGALREALTHVGISRG